MKTWADRIQPSRYQQPFLFLPGTTSFSAGALPGMSEPKVNALILEDQQGWEHFLKQTVPSLVQYLKVIIR